MVFALVLTFDLSAGSLSSDGYAIDDRWLPRPRPVGWIDRDESRAGERQSVRLGGTPPALQAVLADAATRSGADRGHLQVLRMEPAEWPDTGLGCPQPGQLYLQVITPGWLIEVRGGQKAFEYHTDGGDRFVLCVER